MCKYSVVYIDGPMDVGWSSLKRGSKVKTEDTASDVGYDG